MKDFLYGHDFNTRDKSISIMKRDLLRTLGVGIVLLSLLFIERKFLPYLLICLGWIIVMISDEIIIIGKYKRYKFMGGILAIITGIIGEIFNFCFPFDPCPMFHVYWIIIIAGGVIMIVFYFISSKKLR